MNVDTCAEDEEVVVFRDTKARRIERAELSADCAVVFYRHLRVRLIISEDAALALTAAWVRGGMP